MMFYFDWAKFVRWFSQTEYMRNCRNVDNDRLLIKTYGNLTFSSMYAQYQNEVLMIRLNKVCLEP